MVNTYARLIEAGEMTLNDIESVKMREKVLKKLIEDGWITE